MKNKADHTLATAQFLVTTQKHPNESVHCSYYAVFQYMVYYLAAMRVNPIPYDEQRKRANSQGSHNFVIEEIGNRMKAPAAVERQFKQKVRNLKQARVQADYEVESITIPESLRYKQLADGLIAQLKQYFKDKI